MVKSDASRGVSRKAALLGSAVSAALLFAPAAFAQERPVLPWMSQRPVLDDTYTAEQKREFNANWGNAAIGQGYALNLTTRPDGTALPGKGITGRGIVVGVIDSGIDAIYANPANRSQGFSSIHPEFLGRLDTRSVKTLADATMTSEINDTDPGNLAGHGTHVAGTIGAALNGVGMMGIAPSSTILAVKGLGTNTDSDNSIAYLNQFPEVRIINGSFGPIIPKGTTVWATGNLDDEITAVRQSLTLGKVLVVAAGNDGTDSPTNAKSPTGIGLFPYLSPTNAKSGIYNDGGKNYNTTDFDKLPGKIVAVANLAIDFTIAATSNRCGVAAFWCISAPGGGDAGGTVNGIISTYPRGNKDVQITTPDGAAYTSINGTSMAAPHVSGALAVLMEAYPNYTTKMIVNLMFATAEDLGAPGVDNIYGHGLVRLDRALTPSPTLAANGTVAVGQGGQQIWTTPVDSTGVLTINNSNGPSASVVAALSTPLAATVPANAGELLIAGEASFSQVNLQSGVLTVDGVLTSPTINVGRNASLQGMGDIHGNITVNGRLAPDGELWAFGNVTMGSTGTLRTDIDGRDEIHGPGGYDTLVVLGAGHWFTAGGTYAARFRGIEKDATNTFTPSIGDRFLSVIAVDGAGVRGRFDKIMVEADPYGVTGMPVGARLDVFYYPDAIVAAITPESFANLRPAGITLDARQTAVGAAIDRFRPAQGAEMNAIQSLMFDALYALTPGEIPQALTSISGPGYGATSTAIVSQTMLLSNAVQQRVDAVRGGFGAAQASMAPTLSFSNDRRVEFTAGLPAEMAYAADYPTKAPRGGVAPDTGWSVWGQAVGATGHVGNDGFGPGYSIRGGGIAVGADKVIQPGVLFGIAGLYSHSVTNTDGGVRSTADTFVGALYGSWTRGGWELDGLAGVGGSSVSSQRSFTLAGTAFAANSSHNGVNALATAELGYRFYVPVGAHAGFFKPLVGLSYGGFSRDTFTETGAGGFNLTVMSDTASRFMSKVGFATGVDIRTEHMVLRPELRLAWGHDFNDTGSVTASLLGTNFTTLDAQPGRDAALVGVQLSAMGKGGWQVFGGYAGDYRSNATIHSGNIGAKVRF